MSRKVGGAFGLGLLLATSAVWAEDVPAKPRPSAGPVTPTPTTVAPTTPERTILEHALAGLPAGWLVRYGDLTQDSDGTLALKDVVLSHEGKLLLAANSVRVTRLRGDGSAGAPYAADRVEATALGEPNATGGDTADTLVVTGVSVGPGDAAGLPPGSRAAAITQAVAATRVDHAELAGVHDPEGAIDRITLDHLALGVVAAVTMSDLAFQSRTDGRQATITSIEVQDIDIARLVRVFEPSSYVKDVARLAVGAAVGRLALRGLALVKGEGATQVDAIELTDLRLGQLPEAPAPDAFLTAPAALGDLVIGGVHHHSSTAHEASFDLASIALSNYRDGRFDTLRLGETRFTDPGTHTAFGMKSAEIRDFNATSLMAWALLGIGRDRADMSDGATPLPPRLGGFNLIDLFVDAPSGDRVTIGAIRDRLAYQDDVPVLQEFSINRLVMPTHLLEQMVDAGAVAAFGRDTVAADLDLKLAWNAETHDLMLTPLRLAADELGTLTLTLTFGNVDLSFLSKGAMAGLAGLIVATIKDGELIYADASLLDRVIAAYAATVGQTPAAMKVMLVTELGKMKSPLPSRPALLKTLAGFLQHPGTLTARIAPATPFPAGQLLAGSPDDSAKKLGLVVTAQ